MKFCVIYQILYAMLFIEYGWFYLEVETYRYHEYLECEIYHKKIDKF